jgi:aminopeptidase N
LTRRPVAPPRGRSRAGEEETLVRSVLTFTRTPGGSDGGGVASPPLELAGSPEIVLRSLSLNGAPLAPDAYARTPKGGLLLHAPLPDGGPFTLAVETALKPQDNTSLEGLYKSSGARAGAGGRESWLHALARSTHACARCVLSGADAPCVRRTGNFCTQCEAEGFRRITFYLCAPRGGHACTHCDLCCCL